MNQEILDEPFEENEEFFFKKVSPLDRLKAMLLDHFLMVMILGILTTIPMIFVLNKQHQNNTLINDSSLSVFEMIFFSALFSIYIMKDLLNSRSLAKRYMGQIVLDSKTKRPAGEIKCIIRNITLPFSILEVLVILLSPSKRIGDYIAGTEIMKTDSVPFSETKKELSNYDKFKFIKYWLIITVFLTLILLQL